MGKKLVQINTVCNNSTGRIMHDIQKQAEQAGFNTISFVGRRKVYTDLKCEKIGNFFSFWIHVFINTVFDRQGYGSYFVTKKLIRRIREEKPDIIHLHNIHGYYLYIPSLFKYLSDEYKGKIIWTLHDCWPFTGHCPHFASHECNRWMTECYHCPCKKEYPVSLILDASRENYRNKKQLFTNLQDLTITTPSQWMAENIRKSFLNKYQVCVINNGIDLEKFKYTIDSQVLKKYCIRSNKKILLGVASVWDKRKGLDDFIELSKILPLEYQIVLVGLSCLQIKKMPPNIIGIKRTENIHELAVLYSAAHIFVNPSMEESFSLVTVEAMACGTPVIVLDTSAVKELVNEKSGVVLHEHTSEDYLSAIVSISTYDRAEIRESVLKYSNQDVISNFIHLYSE